MIICENIIQNSEEWNEIRRGIPTASSFEKIVTTKGERSKQRVKYLYKLAGERLSGESSNGYYNANMEKGHEREDESRKMYELINGVTITQPGFCFFDEKKEFGCSPDGLIDEDGGFETKNAEPHVQIDRLENVWSKAEHFQQVQGSLYVTGRSWWDLVSYSRGIKPITVRFERDGAFISKLADEIEFFLYDLNKLVNKYKMEG